MNENLPPPVPEAPKPMPASSGIQKPSGAPTPWKAAGLGALLFIVSAALCFVSPFLTFFGFVFAFACLFIPGYRCIFVGYILAVGLLLLGVIIYCANNPVDFK